jgi:hypothetical protein
MSKVILSILVILLPLAATSQQAKLVTVSGVLTANNGDPLPGVNVRIKGSNQGTSTNLDGYYSIDAPVGSTLVYAFIGFSPKEVVVTEAMGKSKSVGSVSYPNYPTVNPTLYLPNGKPQRGVAVLSDSSAGYAVEIQNGTYLDSPVPQSEIRFPLADITTKRVNGKRQLVLQNAYAWRDKRPHVQVEYNSSVSFSEANSLPERQNTYAQGYNPDGELQYIANSPLSWGPALANLKVNENGNLDNAPGTANPAPAYNPYDALRKGWATHNGLQLTSSPGKTELRAGLSYGNSKGILPGTETNNLHLNFSGKLKTGNFRPQLIINHSANKQLLPEINANLSRVWGSIHLTPPSFDLLNGKSASDWQNKIIYTGERGERTYAPGFQNHPYWLLNSMPDRATERQWLAGLNLDTHYNGLIQFNYKASVERSTSETRWGYARGTAGVPYGYSGYREANNTTGFTQLRAYTHDLLQSTNTWELKPNLAYRYQYTEYGLKRYDRLGYFDPNNEQSQISSPTRHQQEIVSGLSVKLEPDYTQDLVSLTLHNTSYTSTTLPGRAKLFQPSGSLAIDLSEVGFLEYSEFLTKVAIEAQYSRIFRENELLYNQYSYLSTYLPVNQYQQFLPTYELLPSQSLEPEEYRKFEIGSTIALGYHSVSLSGNYFNYTTQNLILPNTNANRVSLENVARVRTTGWELGLNTKYFDILNWDGRISFNLHFTRQRPVTEEVYGAETSLALAGFQEVSTQLVEGQPVGVIVGSSYVRNSEGELVIGSDGFPLVNNEAGVVGNPNPDWQAGFTTTFRWKALTANFNLEGQYGADVWNGTRRFMDHFGTSAETGERRLISDYVFEGVTEGGQPNTQPVALYNPQQPLQENYWLRYGLAGVTEEYIEQANWLRLGSASIGYNFSELIKSWVNFSEATLSFQVNNILLAKSYSGVDPVNPLFGQAAGTGLDLFNQPNTRSYGLSFTLTY